MRSFSDCQQLETIVDHSESSAGAAQASMSNSSYVTCSLERIACRQCESHRKTANAILCSTKMLHMQGMWNRGGPAEQGCRTRSRRPIQLLVDMYDQKIQKPGFSSLRNARPSFVSFPPSYRVWRIAIRQPANSITASDGNPRWSSSTLPETTVTGTRHCL